MKKLLWIFSSSFLLAPTGLPIIEYCTYQPRPIQERFTNKFHVQIQVPGMMNDIQGGFYREGKWHVYFLYNDELRVNSHALKFGDKSTSFYHVTTTDWIHWEYVGVAIPKNLTPYKDVSSGTFFEDTNNLFGYDENGRAIIVMATSFYGNQQNILGYYSLDNGYTFSPIQDSPIIRNEQKLGTDKNMRDPYFFTVWKNNHWEYVMYNAENTEFGVWVSNSPTSGYQRVGAYVAKHPMLECPNLFQLQVTNSNEQKWVLFYGGNGGWGDDADNLSTGTYYIVGSLDENNVFVADADQTTKRLDFGPDFYAAKFLTTSSSNTNLEYLITTGWVGNWNYNYVYPQDGRIGKMSLARKIKLIKNETNQYVFENEILGFENISQTTTKFVNQEVLSFQGGAFKLVLNLQNMLDYQDLIQISFSDKHYLVTVALDFANNQVSIQRTSADSIVSRRKEYSKVRTFSTDLHKNLSTTFEIYLDRSVLEIKFPDQKIFTVTKVLGINTQETVNLTSQKPLNGSYEYYDMNNFISKIKN